MRFIYWCRMQELVMNNVKVPKTMFVRQEMVMYLHGFRERESGGVGGQEQRWRRENQLDTYVSDNQSTPKLEEHITVTQGVT